jgi:hypothetical protein
MEALKRFLGRKSDGLQKQRPGYPVPEYMSADEARRIEWARADLRREYNREMAKPASQRNTDLMYKMDRALYPRLGGW